MATKKYKAKPQFVEAEQWFPGKKVTGVVEGDIAIGSTYYHASVPVLGFGPTGIEASDWVVHSGGRIQVIKDRVFRANYVTLDDGEIPNDITRVETEVIRRTHDKRPT
jgi:hypothetical protein